MMLISEETTSLCMFHVIICRSANRVDKSREREREKFAAAAAVLTVDIHHFRIIAVINDRLLCLRSSSFKTIDISLTFNELDWDKRHWHPSCEDGTDVWTVIDNWSMSFGEHSARYIAIRKKSLASRFILVITHPFASVIGMCQAVVVDGESLGSFKHDHHLSHIQICSSSSRSMTVDRKKEKEANQRKRDREREGE